MRGQLGGLLLGDVFTAGPIQQAMGETITRGLVISNRTRDEWVVELNRHFIAGTQCVIMTPQHRLGAENRQILTIDRPRCL